MTDPRLVEPQRLVTAGAQAACDDTACGDTACGDEHVYWCWKRKTGAALLVLLLAGSGLAARRRWAR